VTTVRTTTTALALCLAGTGAAGQQTSPIAPQAARTDVANRRTGSSPTAMGLQGYSVVLVVGDMTSAGGTDTVPAAARKALTDMQAFLPYRRYQLLDSAWMVCCAAYRATIAGRLRGPEERDFAYTIETMTGENGKLTLRFALRDAEPVSMPLSPSSARSTSLSPTLPEPARAEYSRQLYDAQKERDDAEMLQRRAKQGFNVGTTTDSDYESARKRYQLALARVADLEATLGVRSAGFSASRASLLDSTFAIAVGETVVIGTSRLKGDQALIALLTAAGKPTGR